jgi:hypothetical protein
VYDPGGPHHRAGGTVTLLRVMAVLAVGIVIGAGATYVIVVDDESTNESTNESNAASDAHTDIDGPGPRGATSNLFVQTAADASVSAQTDGTFTLTLDGARDLILYFADRPGHAAGSMTVSDMVASVFDESPGPNAALVGQTKDGSTIALAVSLRDPGYDGGAEVMTYQMSVLGAEQGPEGFEYGSDVDVPDQLSNAELYIDSATPMCAGSIVNESSQQLGYAGTFNSDPVSYQPSSPLFVDPGVTKLFSWAEPSTTNRIDGSIGYFVTEADGSTDTIFFDFLCTWDSDGNLFITNVGCQDWTRVACAAAAPNQANLTITFTDK